MTPSSAFRPTLPLLLLSLVFAPLVHAAESPYHITYANGVTVDVLAVSVVPSRNQPFWLPDGSRLIAPPYDGHEIGNLATQRRNAAAGGQPVYEITVRIAGAADPSIQFRERAANGVTVGAAGRPFNGAATLDDLIVYEATVTPGAETLDFELGVAANTWKLVRAFKTPGVYGTGPDKVEVVEPKTTRGKADLWFRVNLAPTGDALRLVAVDDAGNAHRSTGSWWMGQEAYSLEAVFPDLARDKVREFRVERCPFEWKPVTGIHLQPPGGDLAALVSAARAKRLIAEEARYREADSRKIDAAIETLARIKLDDADEWGGAIRDLAAVGAPAVPAVCAELQRTARPYTRSALSIALRAIDDPRAVPALAAALADCPFAPNDYGGLRAKDPAVLHFMLGLQNEPGYRGGPGSPPTLSFGRPVNEITRALTQLSGGHSEGNAPARQNERKVFQQTAKRWQTWWDKVGAPEATAGLPLLRIAADPGAGPVTPTLPDDLHISAALRDNPKLAKEPLLDRWTMLHLAVALDRINVIEALVGAGADVNAPGWNGWTPLHLAAVLGRRETVEFLVSQKADVRAKTGDGVTPLHAAAGACTPPTCRPLPAPDPEIIKLLLDRGADPSGTDARGRTPLHGAVARADAGVLQLLIDRGASVNAKDDRARTALHRAVECGNEAAVDLLLAAKADVNAADATGRTPIRLAPYSLYYLDYNPPAVKKLLDHGAQVDLTTTLALGTVEQVAAAIARDPAAVNQPGQTDDGRLPLHWAASRKSPEMVKLLLDHGADPNGREKDGNPPLTTAVFAGEPKVVAALIAAKADVNPRGQGDTTPLYWACTRLDVDVINLLLAAGANPNTSDPKQPQPLSAVLQSVREGRFGEQASPEERRAKARVILAALLDHKADVNGKMWGGGYSPLFSADEDLAEFLVAHGAKTDVVTDDGNSLLHYAAMTSRADLARFALKHNLPLEARNKKGETPLLCAVGYFNPRNGVLDLLLAKSPDLTATDADGRSPLHRAAQIGSVAAVTALLDRQADPQAKDSEGATPLHLAAKAAHDDLIPLLVTRGAPVNATDKSGRTPLDYATKPETRKVLTTHGATGG